MALAVYPLHLDIDSHLSFITTFFVSMLLTHLQCLRGAYREANGLHGLQEPFKMKAARETVVLPIRGGVLDRKT